MVQKGLTPYMRVLGQPLRKMCSKPIKGGDGRIRVPQGGDCVPDGAQPSRVLSERAGISFLQQRDEGADLFDALASLMHASRAIVSKRCLCETQLLADDVLQAPADRLFWLQCEGHRVLNP